MSRQIMNIWILFIYKWNLHGFVDIAGSSMGVAIKPLLSSPPFPVTKPPAGPIVGCPIPVPPKSCTSLYMDRTVIFDLPLEAYKVWTQMVIQYIRWRNIPTGFNHRPQVGRSVLKILGCFKSAKIFICQKVQHFQADSEYLGKINTKNKISNFFFNV